MADASSSERKGEVHVVTGGGGFPGFRLGKKLAEMGHVVRLVDIRPPVWDLVDGMQFHQGSITDEDSLSQVIKGAVCVYHLASYGMSGGEQLNQKMTEIVNVMGTEKIIEACLRHNVTRLVYASTYNVVFHDQEIRNGDSSLPYTPLDKFTDHYSRTKMIADKKVLAANGRSTADGSIFRTCALRLAGIYGPGELRHQPRIVKLMEQGLVQVTTGARDSLCDFLHVDNLANAHALAGEALGEGKGHVAAGKAYFISDNKPINNFQFYRQLIEGLGYTYPKINLPLWLTLYLIRIMEILHIILKPVYYFQPVMTVTEVYKSSLTHYFSIESATKDLGYLPCIQNDLSEVVTYYRKLGRVKGATGSSFTYYFVNVLIIIAIYYALTYFLPGVTSCFR